MWFCKKIKNFKQKKVESDKRILVAAQDRSIWKLLLTSQAAGAEMHDADN